MFNGDTEQSKAGNDKALADKTLCKAMGVSTDGQTLPISKRTRSEKLPSFLPDRLALSSGTTYDPCIQLPARA